MIIKYPFIISLIIIVLIMVIEFVFHFVVEIISSIKDKPRLFIYELIFKGFVKENQKQYQLKGRLVGDNKQSDSFKSISFKKKDRWEPNIEEKKKSRDDSILINNNLTIKKTEDLGKNTIYDIVGNYTVSNSSNKDLSYSSLEFSLEKKDNKGEERMRVIKCPNIRKSWLLFYIFFSMMVLYMEITSALICINNWNYILNANHGTHTVFLILGLFLFLITVFTFAVFFLCVYWKSLSGYIILMQMKKYGVPPKTEKVSEKYLITKIFEYMTGTESVDNIL